MHITVFSIQGCSRLTAIPIIIEGQFQAFQRFSSSKLVLKTVENRSTALNYYGIASTVFSMQGCSRLSDVFCLISDVIRNFAFLLCTSLCMVFEPTLRASIVFRALAFVRTLTFYVCMDAYVLAFMHIHVQICTLLLKLLFGTLRTNAEFRISRPGNRRNCARSCPRMSDPGF
jgi:hypothetical protein